MATWPCPLPPAPCPLGPVDAANPVDAAAALDDKDGGDGVVSDGVVGGASEAADVALDAA